MKKAILCLFVVLILASLTLAQENMGARPIGMGGAFTGLADDVNAIFVNPAGIGYLRGEQALVSTKFSEGKEYTIIGGVERTPIGSFGVGYVGSSASLNDEDTSTRAINQTLILSYARELNEFMVIPKHMGKLSLGTNLKFSSLRLGNAQGLAETRGSALNADIAAVFRPNDDFSWGVSVKNCFDKNSQANENQIESGMDVAFGISGKVFNKSLIWSAEGKSLGCEWRPVRGLALRVGKDGDYNTAGFGINVHGFCVDYGYMEKEEPVHYVAVSIAIDREKASANLRQASLNLE
ncbi:MAG: hypothetical protein V3T21_06875 [Candidatus Margulisiibacteriota bacterium]